MFIAGTKLLERKKTWLSPTTEIRKRRKYLTARLKVDALTRTRQITLIRSLRGQRHSIDSLCQHMLP